MAGTSLGWLLVRLRLASLDIVWRVSYASEAGKENLAGILNIYLYLNYNQVMDGWGQKLGVTSVLFSWPLDNFGHDAHGIQDDSPNP